MPAGGPDRAARSSPDRTAGPPRALSCSIGQPCATHLGPLEYLNAADPTAVEDALLGTLNPWGEARGRADRPDPAGRLRLSGDITSATPEEIRSMTVAATIVGGVPA